MLSIKTIGKTYPNGTVALREISLEIGAGEIVASAVLVLVLLALPLV